MVYFFLGVFPGSPLAVFQREKLPAEISYISPLGVTSLFWGPRSGELGLGLQMGPMGPLPPTDPLRGGVRVEAGKLLEADAHLVSPARRHGPVLVMKPASSCNIVFACVSCMGFLSIRVC